MFFRRISVLVLAALLMGVGARAEAVHTLHFGKSASSLSSRSANAQALDAIGEDLTSSCARIVVKASSSPDGPLSLNSRLARQRAEGVVDALKGSHPELWDSLFTFVYVDEDWDGVKRYVEKSSKPWKAEALEILGGDPARKEQLLRELWVGEAWEDLAKNCFPSLRKVSVRVDRTADVRITFPCGRSGVNGDFAENAFSLAAARKLAKDRASTLCIYAYASPEGSTQDNLNLCKKRAEAVREILIKAGRSPDTIQICDSQEDWDGLLEKLRGMDDCPDRESVIGILDNESLTTDGKRSALKKLSSGKTWRWLIVHAMPELRAAVVIPS